MNQKHKPPEPPPMGRVTQDGSTGFGFYLAMCVVCIAAGIMMGLKMAGKL